MTPFFQFFYWGDEISLAALKGQATPKDYGGKVQTMGDYWTLVKLLGERIKAAGVPALVCLETEWNKTDILKEPAVWDKVFADSAATLKGLSPAIKVVTAPGAWSGPWGDVGETLARFPAMVKACDFVGTQTLRSMPRSKGVAESYDTGPDKLLAALKALQRAAPGKPVLVTDVAFSAYGGSYNPDHPFAPANGATEDARKRAEELRQAKAWTRMRDLLPEFQKPGLEAIIMRSVKDNPNFAVANYHGYAERAWGMVRPDGSRKPSYDAVLALGKAMDAAAESFSAAFEPRAVDNDGWVEVAVKASHEVVEVTASVNGAPYVPLDRTTWGTWAKSLKAPDGSRVVFIAKAADGRLATSPGFAWDAPAPAPRASPPSPAPAPPQEQPSPAPADPCQPVKDENAALRQENATLRAENEALKQQVAKVSEDRDALARKVEAVKQALTY